MYYSSFIITWQYLSHDKLDHVETIIWSNMKEQRERNKYLAWNFCQIFKKVIKCKSFWNAKNWIDNYCWQLTHLIAYQKLSKAFFIIEHGTFHYKGGLSTPMVHWVFSLKKLTQIGFRRKSGRNLVNENGIFDLNLI